MPGRVSSNHLVMRCIGAAAGITRDGAGDTLDMLEHALDSPEAATGENRDLRRRLRARRFVNHGRGNRARALSRRREDS